MSLETFQDALGFYQAGELARAQLICTDLLARNPEDSDVLLLQGGIWGQQGLLKESLEMLEKAVALRPNSTQGYIFLANTLAALKRFQAALEACDQALSLQPHSANTWYCRGNILRDMGRLEEAILDYDKAIEISPNQMLSWNNKGQVLHNLNRPEEALSVYEQALQRVPGGVDLNMLNNRATALYDLDRLDEALATYHRTLALFPDSNVTHLNRAFLWLKLGEYALGWRAYEARFFSPDGLKMRPKTDKPCWLGEGSIVGKTLYIHPEQGFGDTIHFVRYALLAEAAGARVMMSVPKPLVRIIKTVSENLMVQEDTEPLPDFDLYCPAMSLPLAFGTTVDTIPAPVPYLSPDPEEARRWGERIRLLFDKPAPLLKVGIVWAGNPRKEQRSAYAGDRQRSVALADLAPLLSVPEVAFFSLQKDASKGEILAELREGPWKDRLTDWTDELKDFADTAALLANLDLLITVDTSMLHLAAAMGKPVWMLDRLNNCWRWLRGKSESPWYPTLKIFRQTELGQWRAPIEALAAALHERMRHIQQDIPPPQGFENFQKAMAAEGAEDFRLACTYHLRYLLEAVGQSEYVTQAYEGIFRTLSAQHLDKAALSMCDQALLFDPENIVLLTHRASFLLYLSDFKGSAECYEKTLSLQPDAPSLWYNLSVPLRCLGEFDEAMACHEHALQLDPGNRRILTTRALIRLNQGDFLKGWEDYEWGLGLEDMRSWIETDAHRWHGTQSLRGKVLLIHQEQGYGDVLQFCRYVVLVAQHTAARKIIVGVQKPLVRLVRTLPVDVEVITEGDNPGPIDYYCPMLSLPMAFRTTLQTIPGPVPYLFAGAAASEAMAKRMGPRDRFRVGLAWSGAAHLDQDKLKWHRNIPFRLLEPLLDIEGIAFYSLQKDGGAVHELRQSVGSDRVTDWMDEFDDFADTAALVDNLDLVITVDTAVAHMVGAMGKPVWLMVCFDACWRWLRDREDSPWYSTMRIFRQKEPGSWENVAQAIAEELKRAKKN